MITMAYIDPGTGAIALQLLIAGLAGGMFYFRKAIAKIFQHFKKKPEEQKDSNES